MFDFSPTEQPDAVFVRFQRGLGTTARPQRSAVPGLKGGET